MDVLQDITKWTRDQKVGFLNSVSEDDEFSVNAFPFLKILIEDPDPEVRRLAVTALWDYAEVEIIDRLFDIAINDPSPEVRSKAVTTLGRYIYEGDMAEYDYDWGELNETMRAEQLPEHDFERVKECLLNIAHDGAQDLATRAAAVEAVSFLDTPEVNALIEEAYRHDAIKMKVSALFGMGRSGNRRWSSIILKELESPLREMRFEATRAAGEAYLEEAGPLLRRLAESADHDLRLEAIWALGKTGGPGAHRFLVECSESDDADVREVAEAALDELEMVGMSGGDDE